VRSAEGTFGCFLEALLNGHWTLKEQLILDEGAVIGVNDVQSEYRQRFTIGHELGHYLLDHHERFHIDLGPHVQHGDPPGYDWQSGQPIFR
jgi:hypothetical protein